MKNATDPTVIISPEYRRFVEDLKARVISARISAARAVNRDLTLLYWDIGRGIVEKQRLLGWGESVVEMVSADLRRAFPQMTGFSPRNVWYMRRVFEIYGTGDFLQQAAAELERTPANPAIWPQAVAKLGGSGASAEFLQQLVAEIPWGHHLLILDKLSDPASRLYYLRATAQFGWTRNVLLNQIKAGAYERAVTEKKSHNFPLALPEHVAEQADEMLNNVHRHHPVRGKGRRGSRIRPARQAQSHRRGGLSTAIETAGESEGETADCQTTCRCRALRPAGKEWGMSKDLCRCQPPTPAKEFLAEFWKQEKEAEKMLEGLANS